jgi:hypothetical protein
MQTHPDVEDQYIRWCINRLNKIDKRLNHLGYYGYKKGDLLLYHADEGKTRNKFDKRRTYWDGAGSFVGYKGRSTAIVKNSIDEDEEEVKELPLFFTRHFFPEQRNLRAEPEWGDQRASMID